MKRHLSAWRRSTVMLLSLGLCCIGPTGRAQEDPIAQRIAQMSLREKVGQLFVIRPDVLEGRFDPAQLEDNSIIGSTKVTDAMREVYALYPCGGFTLFRKNLLTSKQLKAFTQDLKALGDIAPLVSIDEEGGRVARIGNHPAFSVTTFPPMGEIAAAGDEDAAYEAGKTIGEYLRDYGIDVDFAPVADVNTNPKNPVIGDRAFGDDPQLAAKLVSKVIEGLHDSGVASCIKHFPGHGDTATDTHKGYAETLKTWEEIAACEMIPFRAGIDAGTDMVMTAHIAAPNVTGSDEPSTVSRIMLTEKLRGEMGYDGLIITDALAMGAIAQEYSSSEASVLCIEAGADLLLMPLNYFEAFEGVVHAVETGRITEERIEQSVHRILSFKQSRMAR